jgi:hypothetical protein
VRGPRGLARGEPRARGALTQTIESLPGKGGAVEVELRIERARLKTFARHLRLRGWEWQLRHLAAHLELFHRGSYTRAIAEGEALLEDRPALGERVSRTEANLALALADVGRDDEARVLLREASRGAFTADSQAALLWARSEVDWLAGRPLASLDRTAECLDLESPFRGLAIDTACWASLDTGTSPPPALEAVEYPVMAGAKTESLALVELLKGGSPGDAAALFEQAAAEWSGQSLRSELRCLWGGGEAARRAGDPEPAQTLLLEVERRAEAHGLAPLLGRIRRSLRGAGIGRSEQAPQGSRGLPRASMRRWGSSVTG